MSVVDRDLTAKEIEAYIKELIEADIINRLGEIAKEVQEET